MSRNNNRDDFTTKTIQILGKRVNFICSNPDCRTTVVPFRYYFFIAYKSMKSACM